MRAFQGAIFDVDGVLVDSPHELAWRESLQTLMEGEWREVRDQTSWTPERFTSAMYQEIMAGKPRMAGARAALEHFGAPDMEARAERYAAAKQEQIIHLIGEGRFMAFPDALRFILAVKAAGIRVAAASSSKNARLFLERIRLDTFAAEQRLDYDFIHAGMTLAELFDADISGRDFPRGKPDPTIFLTAAQELGVRPAGCFVVEDATSGCRRPRRAGWRRWGWPAWTTATCWPRLAPIWSCPPSIMSRWRRSRRVAWGSDGRWPSCAGGTPSGRRASGGWSTTASTLPGKGCGRPSVRSATGTS
jgi:beta-phosphoglucomutase